LLIGRLHTSKASVPFSLEAKITYAEDRVQLKMLHRALKLLRTSHDFTQKELAKKLGISASHLSEIESGQKTPSLVLLERYGEVFEVPVSSILFLAENIERQPQDSQDLVSSKVLALLNFLAELGHIG
jgi:transcriptional regulator with XRE-family HTH domain